MNQDGVGAAKPVKEDGVREVLDLDVLAELESMLKEVTEAHVNRVESKFDQAKEQEKELGTLHNMTARKLWALSVLLGSKAVQAHAQSVTVLSDEEEHELDLQSDRFKEFSDFARGLFWMQVHADMNQWTTDIGIRSGWMLVRVPQRPRSGPEALFKLITGGGAPE